MLFVEDVGAVVVREHVVGARVGEELDILAEPLQLLFELADRLGVGEVVFLGVMALHRSLQLVVGLRVRPRDQAVIRHDRLDRVRSQRREPSASRRRRRSR